MIESFTKSNFVYLMLLLIMLRFPALDDAENEWARSMSRHVRALDSSLQLSGVHCHSPVREGSRPPRASLPALVNTPPPHSPARRSQTVIALSSQFAEQHSEAALPQHRQLLFRPQMLVDETANTTQIGDDDEVVEESDKAAAISDGLGHKSTTSSHKETSALVSTSLSQSYALIRS